MSGPVEQTQQADVLAPVRSYLRRHKKLPTVWCAGCGLGIIQGAILSAIDQLGLDRNKVVVMAGIGCTGRMPTYLDFNTLHVTHGRAIPAATGIKLANPELTIFVVMGDGDAAAIGGNHLIHAARRNIDLNAIIVNNYIYGMTGGQYSPTTPVGAKASTAPHGHIEPPFDISALVAAAGATYVARTTAFHPQRITDYVKQAVQNPGFSVVEIMSNCHTTYGRRNRMRTPIEMMRWLKEHAVGKDKWAALDEAQRPGGSFPVGVFVNQPRPEYTGLYQQLVDRVAAEAKEGPAEAAGAPVEIPKAEPLPEPAAVRLSGSGGQGMILAGVIFGSAASIYNGRYAAQVQSYGPEARGGASRSDVIVCDEPIVYPEADEFDLMLCMTQEACTLYAPQLKPGGTLLVDSLYVKKCPVEGAYALPLTEIARNVVGREVTANVVALGALSALSSLVTEAAMRAAVLDAAPKGTAKLNARAFDEGVKAARELLGRHAG
jgi:2-oxoglutarate ferredoxin oxidoreductase subunit beta